MVGGASASGQERRGAASASGQERRAGGAGATSRMGRMVGIRAIDKSRNTQSTNPKFEQADTQSAAPAHAVRGRAGQTLASIKKILSDEVEPSYQSAIDFGDEDFCAAVTS